MDGQDFDALTKRLATARMSRLRALRSLLGGSMAAVTGATVASDAADAKKNGAKSKGHNHNGGKQHAG